MDYSDLSRFLISLGVSFYYSKYVRHLKHLCMHISRVYPIQITMKLCFPPGSRMDPQEDAAKPILEKDNYVGYFAWLLSTCLLRGKNT